MAQKETAGILEQIAALLELKGENPFKVRAYTNAARASRAQRWTGGNDVADIPVKTFLKSIDFPGTRKDVDSIIARYEFYQRRGHMESAHRCPEATLH